MKKISQVKAGTTEAWLGTFRYVMAVLCSSFVLAIYIPARGTTWTPPRGLANPRLHVRLYNIARQFCDATYNPHSHMEKDIRTCAYYAYGLLLTGSTADRRRAEMLLKHVLAAQDTAPGSPTCGAFRWFWNAPIADLNSAEFNGLTIAQILALVRQQKTLPMTLEKKLDNSLRLAVGAVLRRHINPGYTNIAFLSVATAAAGAKLLGMKDAGVFAQEELDAILKLAGKGEFAEYLSPTYTGVALYGAYLARQFAFSKRFAATTNTAVNKLWKQVAAAYDPSTYQLGGPYLRAYGNNMLHYAAPLKYFLYLGLNGHYPLNEGMQYHAWDQAGLFMICELPIHSRAAELKAAHPAWREWQARGYGPTPTRQLRQYRMKNFILGTVAFQDEWAQKRNLVAFWRNSEPPPKNFNVGYCIDISNETLPHGFPGGRLNFYCAQRKSAALVALVASSVIPGYPGVSTLLFNHSAKVLSRPGTTPVRIGDGSITAYVYSVSLNSGAFAVHQGAHHLRVTRSWTYSDSIGVFRVLAYLVVFRSSQDPAPKISGIKLQALRGHVIVRAKVDGHGLAIHF